MLTQLSIMSYNVAASTSNPTLHFLFIFKRPPVVQASPWDDFQAADVSFPTGTGQVCSGAWLNFLVTAVSVTLQLPVTPFNATLVAVLDLVLRQPY